MITNKVVCPCIFSNNNCVSLFRYLFHLSKIDLDDGYVGDKYPLCVDQPKYHFLKRGARYRLLGGAYV